MRSMKCKTASSSIQTLRSATAVTVIKSGHPLQGQQLPIDASVARRGDGFIQVILPDGSRTVLPVAWTDRRATESVTHQAGAAFTVEGWRYLVDRIDALLRRG